LDKNTLNDSNLEALNIIKEIDTLSIINKADEILKKKEKRKIDIIGTITCLLLIVCNVIIFVTLGFKVFALLQICIIWISPVLLVLLIKMLTIKEGVKWN